MITTLLAILLSLLHGDMRIFEFAADGVRRIQEVFTDPVDAVPPWAIVPGDEPLNSAAGIPRTEAEYIWSASSAQPFDTYHVQVDWWGREAWLLQDHSTGSVRGYTDANGELVEQYRLDAFGNILGVDKFTLAQPGGLFEGFRQRLGHQGLFVERVDGTTLDPVIAPGAELWALSRSRWYAPELGRFLTSDPNETGVPTVASLAMLGKMPAGPPSGSFSWESHFGDGLDTFTAYGANPIANQDPTGLFLAAIFDGSLLNGWLREKSDAAIGGLQTFQSQLLGFAFKHYYTASMVLGELTMEFAGPRVSWVPKVFADEAAEEIIKRARRFAVEYGWATYFKAYI